MYSWLRETMKRPINNEIGAAAVEYGIMIALIAAVIIGTVIVLGTKVNSTFLPVINNLK